MHAPRSRRPQTPIRGLALAVLLALLLPACGGGGGGGAAPAAEGDPVPIRFDGPTYEAFTAFGGLAGAAVDIYTYETLGQGPRHVVPTEDDGAFGIPQYLVTPNTLILVRVRGGMGSPDGGAPIENQGAFFGLFTPTQVEAETATVSLATTALYLRLRHLCATNAPVSDVTRQLDQRARCILTADLDGDFVEDSTDVAADRDGAVDAMLDATFSATAVGEIFAGEPIPYYELLAFTEPKAPQLMGTNTTTPPNGQVARSLGLGEYAFVAGLDGVLVYNYYPPISDEPRRVQTLNTDYEARDMAEKDGVLYVLTSQGIESWDVRDPIEPSRLDALELTQSFRGEQITIAGTIAYLAMASEGIRMIDIADPENLTEVGTPFNAPCHSVSANGGKLFATGATNGSQSYTYDLTDPIAPSWIGGGNHGTSTIRAVATGPQSAQIVTLGFIGHLDVRDNNLTSLWGEFRLQSQNFPADARLYGDFIVTTHWDGTVELIDVDDHWHPRSVAQVTTPPVNDMGTIGRADTACVTTWGLLIFQPHQVTAWSLDLLERPEPILSRTFINNGSAAKQPLFDGDRCYLTTFQGIHIYDIVDPTAPTPRGTNTESAGGDDLHLVGNTIYTGSSFVPMQIYDVSDPDAPTHEGQMAGRHRGFDSVGDRLYTGLDGDFAVLDISDRYNPTLLGTPFPMTVASNVALFGDLAYVTDRFNSSTGGGFTRVIDITDPESLTQTTAIGPRPISGRPGLIERMPNDQILIGGFNINSGVGGRLEIVDVSDPANPIVRGHELTSGFRHTALAYSHGFAYVTTEGPICIIDVRDPREPWWVGRVPVPRQSGVDVSARCGAAGVDDWGLVTFRAAIRTVP